MTPILRRVLQLLVLVAIQAVLLFLSAGTLHWPAAWWYLGLYIGMLIVASFLMIPNRSEVIAERGKGTQGGKRWDLWITRLLSIPTLGLLILAGLDQRWSWTAPLPMWVFLFGVLAFAFGYGIVLPAMYANQFFSQVVRIQTERGHVAVTEGPYRFIRHPGYCGMLLTFLGAVLLLDSLYGFACYLLYVILVVTRTALEDRTLRAELPGYAEYAKRTKYRLLPGLW